MTESDYILVDNLAKFRIADGVLRGVLYGDVFDVPDKEYQNLMVSIFNMAQRLSEKIKVDEEG